MRTLIALAVASAALALAGTASAGGFANIGVSPLPTGIAPGEPWDPEITIMQHGVTPLDGVTPVLTITEESTGETRAFTGTPTGKPGVYETRVVFPASGRWNVLVETDWWGEARLTFGPLAIDDAPPVLAAPESFPVVPIVAVASLLVLLAAVATLGIRRRWRPAALGR